MCGLSNVFYRQLGASGEAECCALISLLWSKSNKCFFTFCYVATGNILCVCMLYVAAFCLNQKYFNLLT